MRLWKQGVLTHKVGEVKSLIIFQKSFFYQCVVSQLWNGLFSTVRYIRKSLAAVGFTWEQIIMCTAKLLPAKSEKFGNLFKSSVLTVDSFVLSRSDEHMGGSCLQSSAVEPFPCVDSNQERERKTLWTWKDSLLVWKGKSILAWTCSESRFDFSGNFCNLKKRVALQASSHPLSCIRIFCVLRLKFFRHLQFLLSLVGF